jgi:hypothetical protein
MQETLLQSNPIQVISNHGFAEVRHNLHSKQNTLVAMKDFKAGDLISPFTPGMICSEPNYLTVQTGEQIHVTLVPEFLQYINHGCEPNSFFNTTTMELVALRDIKAEEEFSFFYPSTEWTMAQPFYCYCGSSSCLQNIQGASFLTSAQLLKYKFTDFIKAKLTSTNR